MDMGRIIQMVINTVLRRVINEVLNKGMGMFSRRGRRADEDAVDPARNDPAPLPDDAMAAKRARQIANQARRLR